MDHLPAPSTRRIAIYISRPDSPLAANQLAAIQRYACAMGWVTVAIVESDEQRLLDLAATAGRSPASGRIMRTSGVVSFPVVASRHTGDESAGRVLRNPACGFRVL